MANPWFRFYSEFATDPKVQILDETLQRRFIMFLCVTCNGDIKKRSEKELAFLFRISLEEYQETKKELIEADLLTPDGLVKNWDKRQYLSDNSTERVKKHRMKQKETLPETFHAVTETAPDTDTDTDTEEEKEKTICAEQSSPPAEFSFILSDKSMFDVPDEKVEEWDDFYLGIDVRKELQKIVDWCEDNPRKRKTRDGAMRFVRSWLNRADDRAKEEADSFTMDDYLKQCGFKYGD